MSAKANITIIKRESETIAINMPIDNYMVYDGNNEYSLKDLLRFMLKAYEHRYLLGDEE